MSRKALILCVDDEPVNLVIMEELLQDKYELTTAKSGEGCLQQVSQQAPDLILLDVNMPDMDGFAVFRHLAADDATRDIPVLGLSAGAMTADIERARAAGFRDYLTKPVDLDRLVTVLDAALSGTD